MRRIASSELLCAAAKALNDACEARIVAAAERRLGDADLPEDMRELLKRLDAIEFPPTPCRRH